MYTPFNLVYGSNSFLFTPDIIELINVHKKYYDLIKLNYIDYKKDYIPCLIKDVDDDTFTIEDAFGNNIGAINGYFKNNSLNKEDITMPASKDDYSDLYEMKEDIVIIFIQKEHLNITTIFKDDFNYIIFNKTLLERLEKAINVFDNNKLSPYNGSVSEVGDTYIKIKDSDNDDEEVTIDGIDKDKLILKTDDSITIGNYIEKNISMYLGDKLNIQIKKEPKFNINLMLPIEKITKE